MGHQNGAELKICLFQIGQYRPGSAGIDCAGSGATGLVEHPQVIVGESLDRLDLQHDGFSRK